MKDVLSLQKISTVEEDIDAVAGVNSYGSYILCSSLSFYQC